MLRNMLTLTCVSMRMGEGERHVEDNMAHVAMELEREREIKSNLNKKSINE